MKSIEEMKRFAHISLGDTLSYITGSFTSEDLRIIADEMDKKKFSLKRLIAGDWAEMIDYGGIKERTEL